MAPDAHQADGFDETVSPLAIRGIRLVRPFYPTARMAAQSGVVTLHGDPSRDMVAAAGERFHDDELDVTHVARWTVPSENEAGVILDLERMAVNGRTLCPDLEGPGEGLWQAGTHPLHAEAVTIHAPAV